MVEDDLERGELRPQAHDRDRGSDDSALALPRRNLDHHSVEARSLDQMRDKAAQASLIVVGTELSIV